jgi:hypothetical protein
VQWGFFANNDGDAFPQSLEFRIQRSLSFVIVSEGPRQQRRFLGVSIKDAILFLGLYATLFLVLHSSHYRGARLFHSLSVGSSALIALVVVTIASIYAKARHR